MDNIYSRHQIKLKIPLNKKQKYPHSMMVATPLAQNAFNEILKHIFKVWNERQQLLLTSEKKQSSCKNPEET